jgi:hypothetical protein
VLCLVAAAALTGACDPSEPAGSSSPTPRTSQPSSSAVPDGKAAQTILDQTFVGRQELGSGSGALQSQLGNTLPAPDKNVLSVTFAFTCTGNGKVSFKFAVNGKNVSSAAHASTCDRSVFQQSVEVPDSGPITFEADVTGSENGGFAYAYYTEKKQVP